jgi:perosamine synthetase
MSRATNAELFDFCRSLYPGETPVPLHAPRFVGNEKKYLSECIDSTYVSYVGDFVKKFEQKIAEFTGCKYAISLSSGTVALHLALVVAGVEPGDEVLVPSLTFVAAANAVTHARGECIFVDSEADSLGMSPEKLESFLAQNTERRADGFSYNKSTGKRIRACVPVHIFGLPAQISDLIQIFQRFGIVVIEDASESLGSYVGSRHTGSFGLAGVLSFNGNKTLTTGGGGMLLTNDEKFAIRFRHLATTAKQPHAYEFFHDEVGYNYRMPNLNAAVGLAQAENLPGFLTDKRDTAAKYRVFCREHGLLFIDEPKGATSNFWLNAILLDSVAERNEMLEAAVMAKVQIRPIWKLMHHLPMYAKNQRTDMSTAERLESRVVNLPSSVKQRGRLPK